MAGVVPADLSALVDPSHPGMLPLRAWRDDLVSATALTVSEPSGTESPSAAAAKGMSEEGRAFLASDITLRRYLTAKQVDTKVAQEALLASIAWRDGFIRRPFTCGPCTVDGRSHCFIPIGVHPELRMPIVYASQPRAADSGVETQLHHVVHTVEHLFETVPGVHHSWIWIVDFNGWGFSHAMQARVGITTGTVLSQHLPERLGLMILLNPPGVFDYFLAAVKPFMDARTMSKVKTLYADSPDKVSEALQSVYRIPEVEARWIGVASKMEAKPGNLPPLPPTARALQMVTPTTCKAKEVGE